MYIYVNIYKQIYIYIYFSCRGHISTSFFDFSSPSILFIFTVIYVFFSVNFTISSLLGMLVSSCWNWQRAAGVCNSHGNGLIDNL